MTAKPRRNLDLRHLAYLPSRSAQLADILDECQPSVSNLLRGRISQVSIEKLLRYADRLHLQTSIAVRPIEGRSGRTSSRGKQTAHRVARKLATAV